MPISHIILDDKLEKIGDPLPDEPDVWPGTYEEEAVYIKVFTKYQTDDQEKTKASTITS